MAFLPTLKTMLPLMYGVSTKFSRTRSSLWTEQIAMISSKEGSEIAGSSPH